MIKADKNTKIPWDWIGVLFSISAIILSSNKIILCWPCFMTANILFQFHFWKKRDWACLSLGFFYFFLNIYGWMKWL